MIMSKQFAHSTQVYFYNILIISLLLVSTYRIRSTIPSVVAAAAIVTGPRAEASSSVTALDPFPPPAPPLPPPLLAPFPPTGCRWCSHSDGGPVCALGDGGIVPADDDDADADESRL